MDDDEYDPTDPEWPLKMCNVQAAWDLGNGIYGGKTQGEGITIIHPDTGWTKHPELIEGDRYGYNDSRSKNFFVHVSPLGNDAYWNLPDGDPEWTDRKDKPTDKYANDTLETGTLLQPSHGTSTASLMLSAQGYPAGFPDYSEPINHFVTGIAPKVENIPLRVTNSVILNMNTGISTYRTVANAIFWAIGLHDIDPLSVGVISMSLGGPATEFGLYLGEALKMARQRGLIMCAAAGQASGTPVYGLIAPFLPGKSEHVICVAGCDHKYGQPIDGFYGNEVDITAPGWGVTVARTIGATTSFTIDTNAAGTSYSTALTAGACALWQAYYTRDYLIKKYGHPLLHNAFKYVLQRSCDTPGDLDGAWNSVVRGAGVLNAAALLTEPLPSFDETEEAAEAEGWGESEWGKADLWGGNLWGRKSK
ncbi:MAG TPA: S8/S53 family peptidase [Chthoniobacterales bacterium]|jgi:hypothetical protein